MLIFKSKFSEKTVNKVMKKGKKIQIKKVIRKRERERAKWISEV